MSAWKQFRLLLKTQLKSELSGRRDPSETKKHRRFVVGMAVIIIIVIAAVTSAYVAMATVLGPAGLLALIPTLAMTGGSLFCLFTTIYKTNGLLFGFRDYDLVMAMPFRSSVVVAARLMILYIYNLQFLLAVMVPAGIVYGIYAGADFWFYLVFAAETLLTPLIPNVIATFIGTLIAMAASRFERRGIAGIILTLVFMVAWMLFVYNAETVVDQLIVYGPQISRMITNLYPPAAWFTEGCCDLNMGAFALFAVVSLGIYFAYCWLVGRFYRPINSMLSSFSSRATYRMKALRATSARKALLYKEFKRLVGSSNYFLNAGIGPIMCIVLAALLFFGAGGSIGSVLDIVSEDGGELPINPATAYAAVSLFLAFFTGMSESSAVSISLEGRHLWIVKTAPVSTQEILQAKLLLNLIMAGIGCVGAGIFLILALPWNMLYSPFLILTPLIFGVFSTVWGQKMNLRYAEFDWTDETRILKRSKSVTALMFVDMGIAFGTLFGSIVIGPWLMFVADAALVIWAALTYRWLMTKGVEVFNAFSA